MVKRGFFLLVFATTLIVCFISCKKDSGNNNGTFEFRAKFDGNEKVFSVLSSAAKATPEGLYTLTLIGVGSIESISINLWSDADDFTAGKTFSIDAVAGKENVMAYGPNGSTDSTQSYFSYYSYYPPVTEQFNCTITESTITGIKGTFSGYLYQNLAGVVQKIDVTDGTFYARFN